MITDNFGKAVNSHSVDSHYSEKLNLRTKRAKTISSKETENDNSPRVFGQRFNILWNAPTSEKRNPKWRLERAFVKNKNLVDFKRIEILN